jgi:hypothetical protein
LILDLQVFDVQLGDFLGGEFDHIVSVQEDRHRQPPNLTATILARIGRAFAAQGRQRRG